ncbi:protein phosphatase 1 regulatory subunit 42 [Nilaparvata lugens]|uniref:protein phosphatase 1 regulatory subunit 42 n=1 Tax=Nilaparvata lugens TaxID=108931 RepID=UPI00193D9979|nr:protein phosphatase 1 regulatory subunit 42 [Nilaparvata lugens]
MVKLDKDFVLKKALKTNFADEKQQKEAVKNVNHLCLNDKFIDEIGDISPFINLEVLYLHNNRICKIENLDCNLHITHLHLQNNNIEKIENISHLKNLKKLYLGNNRISVVEALDKLENLQELFIDAQKLLPGETLYFDPRTVNALSKTLRILDISNNRITSLDDLRSLSAIEELDASCNEIGDLGATCKVIANWCQLIDLKLQGNPVTRVARYRDTITTLTHKLSNLDGKPIKEEHRSFLQQFEMKRLERKRFEAKRGERLQFSAEIKNLADHLPPGLRHSVSSSVLKETQPLTLKKNVNLMFQLNSMPSAREVSILKRQPSLRPIKRITTAHTSALTRRSSKCLNEGNILPQIASNMMKHN